MSAPRLPMASHAHLPQVGEHDAGTPLRLVKFLKLIEQINQRTGGGQAKNTGGQETKTTSTNGEEL